MWQHAIQNRREYFRVFIGKKNKIGCIEITAYLRGNSPALSHT